MCLGICLHLQGEVRRLRCALRPQEITCLFSIRVNRLLSMASMRGGPAFVGFVVAKKLAKDTEQDHHDTV
jgi:hypothetical protein